ncbi:hypothetical protein FGIG_04851 [Fasciola gigantica]|uniref:Uncharacterized protein n=1 Tax=Fasciola gigantica TaxID=46835 RepID=A0A504YH87_FASGI|nr:hypothetical protein FGIG_04851 [Fasciola gigantica]
MASALYLMFLQRMQGYLPVTRVVCPVLVPAHTGQGRSYGTRQVLSRLIRNPIVIRNFRWQRTMTCGQISPSEVGSSTVSMPFMYQASHRALRMP